MVLDPYDSITSSDEDVGSNAAGVVASNTPPRLEHDVGDQLHEENFCKPLPPLPSADLVTEERRLSQGTRVLGDKSTNLRQRPQAAYSKLPLDALVASGRLPSSTASSQDSVAMGNTGSKSAGSASDKAKIKELDKRIDQLMQQAMAQGEESKKMTAENDKITEKQSPLQRSKEAFQKASRAIKGRVSNINSSNKASRSKHRSSSHTHLGLDNNSLLGLNEDTVAKQRLGRRIAEGENLSNPKIQHLTGDGNIARKPLPVYESMKSRETIAEPEPEEDPFSDGNEHTINRSSQDFSEFDFGFVKNSHEATEEIAHNPPTDKNISHPIQKSERRALVEKHPMRDKELKPEHHASPHMNNKAHFANKMAEDANSGTDAGSSRVAYSGELRSETTPPGGFSNRISGLRQHPYVPGVFATPIDTSSPLARQYLAERANRGDAMRANAGNRAGSAEQGPPSDEDGRSVSSSLETKNFTSSSEGDAGMAARSGPVDSKNSRHSADSGNSEESTSTITPAPGATRFQAQAEQSEKDTTDCTSTEGEDLEAITDKGKGKDATRDTFDDSVSLSQTLFREYPHLQRPDSMILGSYSRMHRRRLTSVTFDRVIGLDDLQAYDVAYPAGGKSKSHGSEE